MAEITIQDVRAKFPQYDDMSDEQLGSALHKKYYSDIPQEQFFQQIGLIQSPERGLREQAQGVAETVGTVASSIVAEPLAGLAGIAQSVNPLADKGAGAEAVEATRESLTYQPRTESGQESLQSFGETMRPVAEFIQESEQGLGDAVFEKTDSPALAAAATTIPTILMEMAGIGLGKGAATGISKIKQSRANGLIARELDEAVPSADQIKKVARDVYSEIDNTGAVVKSGSYQNLVNRLDRIGQKYNIDPVIDPKASAALNRAKMLSGENVPLGELENLRKLTQRALKSVDEDKAIGTEFISTIDDYMDSLSPKAFELGGADAANVGKKYKVARNLWGRAKKSELLDEAMTKAKDQASGFENGIRVQFRQILNNKKKAQYFTPDEKKAMSEVVQGTKGANLAKTVGRLGWGEGQATNVLGASAGTALGGVGGSAVGGAAGAGAGAVIIPIVGQISRQLAQKLTRNNAAYADQVIRAGNNAEKITKAYMRNTPKSERNPAELSELLMRNEIDLTDLARSKDELVRQAAIQARVQRKAAEGGAAAGASVSGAQEQVLEDEEDPYFKYRESQGGYMEDR